MQQRTEQQPVGEQLPEAQGTLQYALSILNAGDHSGGPSMFREFSNAAQELVQSSNHALRQSSQKLSLLEAEVSELRARLESVSENLAREREQRIAAEAQLTAQLALSRNRPAGDAGATMEDLQSKLVQSAGILRETGERQLEVMKRMEAGLQAGHRPMPSPRTLSGISHSLLSGLLPALGGGVLGGGIVLLGMQVTWPGRQTGTPLRTGTAHLKTDHLKTDHRKSDQRKPAILNDGTSQQPRTAAGDMLHMRCQQPCWLDVREVATQKVLAYRNLSGFLSLPIGTGLDVFTGRGDLLKIKINDGPETTFSNRIVVERRILPPRN